VTFPSEQRRRISYWIGVIDIAEGGVGVGFGVEKKAGKTEIML